jgi:alkylated DNA nucleotide flippase Atl1
VLWTDPIESLVADVARGDVSTYGELLARMR